MAEYDYDLFVIGAGSGGTRAARVSASYGAKVAVAEEYRVGGTCVIRGCVPKKLLVYGSHFSEELEDGKNFGWTWENAKFHWPTLRDHVLKDVDRLNNAYTDTLKNHGVEIILEHAELTGPHEIKLSGGKTVTAKYILIAVGAWPAVADFPGSDLMSTSNDMFHLEELPENIIISGGENISSIEVESALYMHPAVLAAAVVAKEDEKWGETPCAFVELKPDAGEVTEAEIIDFCRDNLAHFKCPKNVIFGDLPKTSTGKIQKFVLRDRTKE